MREVGKAVEGGKPEEMTAALGELQQNMTKVASAQTALQNADQLAHRGATTSAGSRSSRRPL